MVFGSGRLAVLAACALVALACQPTPVRTERVLTANTALADLGPTVELLEDPSRTLTFAEVTQRTFQPPRTDGRGFGHTRSAWWARFQLENPGTAPLPVVVQLSQAWVHEVTLFVPDGAGGTRALRTGQHFPDLSRPVTHRGWTFPFDLPPGESTLYLRVDAGGHTLSLLLGAFGAQEFEQKMLGEWAVLLLYWGVLLALALFHALLLAKVWDRTQLLYVLLLVSFLGFQVSFSGASLWLWGRWPALANLAQIVFLSCLIATISLFSRDFLNVRAWSRRLDRLLLGIAAAAGAAGLLAAMGLSEAMDPPLTLLVVVVVVALLWTGIAAVSAGERPARTFLLALSLLLGTSLWVVLRAYRVVPDGLISHWGLELASTAMVFLFALSLGDRIAWLSRALEAAQQRLGEEAVRDRVRQEQYRALFESASDGLVVLERGAIASCNGAAQALLGRTTEALVGHPLAEFSTPGSADPTSGQPNQVQEWSCAHPDGVRPVELTLSPGPGGQVLAILRDQTERRRAALERQKLEEQLQQSQKMESIGRLAGGVAHDFNNLLTGVLCSVDFALEELPAEHPVRTYLEEIRQVGQSGAGLVRQLLAFSRKQLIAPKVVEPAKLVNGLQKMLARLIGEDLELRTVHGADGARIRIDPTQAEQVLVNLVVNARDAMPKGGRITLTTGRTALGVVEARRLGVVPGEYVTLAVSDTGHGIPPEVRAHLFEPFFTTKERGRGTGLGLATVWGAVRQNAGGIEVASEVGAGTTFTLYLPVVEDAATASGQEPVEALPKGAELILLVEDEPLVREVATRVLQRLGYDVRACPDPAAALAAVPALERIPLLLTDLVMPGMNGRELADEVRRLRPGTRVLFTTGYTDDEIVRLGVMDRDYDLLPKPYTPAELARRVRQALDTSS